VLGRPMTDLSHMLGTFSIILSLHASGALGDYNGMDMSMDDGMTMTMGNMLSYLHFTPGDNFLFYGWSPATGKALLGTCIGLFLLALVERWLSMMKTVMGIHWHTRALIELANRTNTKTALPAHNGKSVSSTSTQLSHTSLPFVFAFDFPRAIIASALALIGFTFMLVVMTYQVSFILSIVIGLGVGEVLFGRYTLGVNNSLHGH